MIRKATIHDADAMFEMAKQFAEASPYKDLYTENKLRDLIRRSTQLSGYVSFVDSNGRGMIIGILSEFILGEVLTATELGWWVNPEDRKTSVGKELLQAFEQWAKEQDCKLITMISIDETLGTYYEKCGYTLTERSYMKVL